MKWKPTPIFLSGKSYGQRKLEGYSPWGGKELDNTQQLSKKNSNFNIIVFLYNPMFLYFIHLKAFWKNSSLASLDYHRSERGGFDRKNSPPTHIYFIICCVSIGSWHLPSEEPDSFESLTICICVYSWGYWTHFSFPIFPINLSHI